MRHGEQDSAVDDWADLSLGRYVYQKILDAVLPKVRAVAVIRGSRDQGRRQIFDFKSSQQQVVPRIVAGIVTQGESREIEERSMARVALVSGGTRGIGPLFPRRSPKPVIASPPPTRAT